MNKPSEADRQHLSKLFPSSSSTSAPKSATFNPRATCTVNSQQKRKKKAITRDRARKLTVVLLPKISLIVPKSNARSKLKKDGRIKKLEFRRTMSFLQVKNLLIKSFSAFSLKELCFLYCEQSNILRRASVRAPSGDELMDIAGQGSLYLCEVRHGGIFFCCGLGISLIVVG